MNAWLGVATVVRAVALVAAVGVLVARHGADPGGVVLLGLLVVVHLGVVVLEREPAHQRTPGRWVVTALGTGALAGISTVLALVPVLASLSRAGADLVGLLVFPVVAGVVVGCTRQAAQTLVHPLLPEPGGAELRFLVPVRHEGGVWGGRGDLVVVAADEVLLDAFGGRLGAPDVSVVACFPLRAARAVSVRPAAADEPPYATLPRGWAVHTLAGPLVQLDLDPTDGGAPVAVLPVDDAEAVAALLRYRVWALTGRTPGRQPLGVARPDTDTDSAAAAGSTRREHGARARAQPRRAQPCPRPRGTGARRRWGGGTAAAGRAARHG